MLKWTLQKALQSLGVEEVNMKQQHPLGRVSREFH